MFIIIEGFKNLARAKLSSLMVILVIGAALTVGSWFFLITLKLQGSSEFMQSAMVVEAFLADTVSTETIENLQESFEKNPGTRFVHFISRDSAAAIFHEEVGEDIRTLTGDNPLPPSFRLQLQPDILAPHHIDSVLASFSRYPGVEDVTAHRELIMTLLRYRKIVWITHLLVGIMIGTAAFLFIAYATKLSIVSRKKSIHVMKLVGAKNSFIKGPFIVEGFVEGLIGGVLSIAATRIFISLFKALAGVAVSVPGLLYLSIAAAGCALGVLGSAYALARYSRIL